MRNTGKCKSTLFMNLDIKTVNKQIQQSIGKNSPKLSRRFYFIYAKRFYRKKSSDSTQDKLEGKNHDYLTAEKKCL